MRTEISDQIPRHIFCRSGVCAKKKLHPIGERYLLPHLTCASPSMIGSSCSFRRGDRSPPAGSLPRGTLRKTDGPILLILPKVCLEPLRHTVLGVCGFSCDCRRLHPTLERLLVVSIGGHPFRWNVRQLLLQLFVPPLNVNTSRPERSTSPPAPSPQTHMAKSSCRPILLWS